MSGIKVVNVQSLGLLSPGSVPRKEVLVVEDKDDFLAFLTLVQAVMVVVFVPLVGIMMSGVGPLWAITRAQPEQAVCTVLVTVVE